MEQSQAAVIDKPHNRKKTGRGNIFLPIASLFAISLVAIMTNEYDSFVYINFIAGSVVFGWLLNIFNRLPKLNFLIMLLLVAYLTIFIGLRDFGIGTDTLTYIDDYWEWGEDIHSIEDFGNYDYASNAYLVVSMIGHMFSDDHQTMLVMTALVINFITFLALYIVNYKNLHINWIIYILFWQLLFMNTSMNLMRQTCAQSFVLLSIVLFYKKKRIWSLVCFAIAFEFHSTVLALFPIIICYFLDNKLSPKKRDIVTIVGMIAMAIIIVSIFQVASYFISMGLLNGHFDVYTDNLHFDSTNLFGASYIAMTILFVYICIYLRVKKQITNSQTYLLLCTYGMSFVLRLSAFSLGFLSRLSYYYTYILYFALAYLMTKFSKKIPLLIQAMIYIVIIYTWFTGVIIGGANETYPYQSEFLGIK